MMSVLRRVFMLLAGVAFAGIPTVASAHAGNSDPNMIHACIGNVSKIVRIVGVTGSCISAPIFVAETPTHWAKGTRRAAGPCFDNANRYVDCGNGTVTDTVTGLIWLKQADCFGVAAYAAANQAAAGLKDGDCGGSLTDGSAPGDWRLPTKDEWTATVAHAIALGCTPAFTREPALTNDAGTNCWITGPSSLTGVTITDVFWSSTASEATPSIAYVMFIDVGSILPLGPKTSAGYSVWPVRGGPR
jgi:uncharacterized protein DUF1566